MTVVKSLYGNAICYEIHVYYIFHNCGGDCGGGISTRTGRGRNERRGRGGRFVNRNQILDYMDRDSSSYLSWRTYIVMKITDK